MNGKATREEIEAFITEYNKRIGWNREIQKKIGEEFINRNEDIEHTVKDWFGGYEISEEDKGLEDVYVLETDNADIYQYNENDGRIVVELQAYNLTIFHSMTFFLTLNENEESYKQRMMGFLMEDVRSVIEKNSERIEKLTSQRDRYSKLEKILQGINK